MQEKGTAHAVASCSESGRALYASFRSFSTVYVSTSLFLYEFSQASPNTNAEVDGAFFFCLTRRPVCAVREMGGHGGERELKGTCIRATTSLAKISSPLILSFPGLPLAMIRDLNMEQKMFHLICCSWRP